MKNILCLLLIFTVFTLHAETEDALTRALDPTCSTGAKIEASADRNSASDDAYKLAADLSQLYHDAKVAGEEVRTVYNLNQVGKHQYLALPQILDPDLNAGYFFIAVNDDHTKVTIYTADRSGALCGGGLVEREVSLIQANPDSSK